MNSRRTALRAALGMIFTAAGVATPLEGAEAAPRRKRAAPRKPTRQRRAPGTVADNVNMIDGFPAEVSSIVLVLEENGFRILSEDEPHARRTPASVTKLMTLCLLFDELKAGRMRLEDKITMPASSMLVKGTKLGLAAGRSLSVSDAILALITKSANDVAIAVAEHIAGSEEAFARLMNKKAAEIGMVNSRFVNPHGMRDPDHYATAYDLALLGYHLVRHHTEHYHYFSTLSFIFGRNTYANHNQLMREYDGMDGLKTGMTNHGWQLAASAERTKSAESESGAPPVSHRLIGVFLGGITKQQRNNCLGYLLDQGFMTLGHDTQPSRFRYSKMACTSKRNPTPTR